MPVLSCPKCPTKLKVPDGASGHTRCPKCGTVFPVVKPAFEVVEEQPTPKPAPKVGPKPAPKSAPVTATRVPVSPPPVQKSAFEADEDEPPRKKRPRDDDDEPPRRRRTRDDEDEDDRPRSKLKKKKRYLDDDDDFDDWQPRAGGGRSAGAFAKGRTGAMLIGISFWLNLAAFGLLALYTLIAWMAVSGELSGSSSSRSRSSGGGEGDGAVLDLIVILPGLLGLGAWVVGLTGSAIAIGGPRKARGMAITATVFAALHLVFVGVTFSNTQDGLRVAGDLPGVGKVAWIIVASTLPALDGFLPMLFYNSKAIGGDYVIALLAGACEAARLIFMLLALKSLAAAARDYDASERSGYGVMIVTAIMGGVALVALLVAVILQEGKFKSINTYLNITLVSVFLMYVAYTLMMLSPALSALATRNACARRT